MSKSKIIINFIILTSILLTSYFVLYDREIQIAFQEKEENTLYNAAEWQVDSIYVNGNWAYFNQTYEWCFFKDGVYMIENVTIKGQHNNGIIIANTQDPFIIKNCTINNSIAGEDSAAIKFISVKNGKILGNNISINNGNGILTTLSENITIHYNLINHNEGNGLFIGKSHNFSISSNQIKYNGQSGIIVDAFYGDGVISTLINHKIFNNKINHNSLSGIDFCFCENCTIEENEIHSNGEYGVYLGFWCSNIKVSNNHIIYKQGCVYDTEGRSDISNNYCELDPSVAIPGFNPHLLILANFTFILIIAINSFRRNKFSLK
ncbi:MAG: right-handed parallel beta-helix repeat-containing protein [Promethearchaeota archaeon]|nr:MAG: right-handed parallel beta-helix repeat-containing protein [Candidatus Lokiarchaeota archaeon]